ncbi:MAG: outer membrane beta-barrel family protein [Muribaculaceae bacterium]|nr:outer membrane beta-barrel family protein [Muribaculaceae bacterium]
MLSLLSGLIVCADNITLRGRVKDGVTKYDLKNAIVLLYDSIGNVSDTIRANRGYRWLGNNDIDTLSNFYFNVPAVDSTYVFDVLCEGYKDQTVSFTVSNPGRQTYLEMPVTYMERAPRQLKELSVVSSKIKFYNKGDTVVYNADAFQLAEGSMLDALIAQLPGAELDTNGQIKINGEFVESLLLNGKEFFDKNNNVMLENIAAYTVKDIQVYEGETPDAKRKNDKTAAKVLTMDVRLKKEYNMGWIINAQAGYGTENRYLGRLFANWFTNTTRVSFIGNVNNLNDNRTPGKTDTWTPEDMPSGTKKHQSFGINYNYENSDETRQANGELTYTQSKDNVDRTTYRTNFLPAGNTYEDAFAHSNNRDWKIDTNHDVFFKGEMFQGGVEVSGNYGSSKQIGSSLTGAFDKEPEDMDRKVLEAIYSGNPELVSTIINRSRTASDMRQSNYQVNVIPYCAVKIPKSDDYLNFSFGFTHSGAKRDMWNDYEVNFGSDATPAERRRRYTSIDPAYTNRVSAATHYTLSVKNVWLILQYRYNFTDNVRDQSMYALERLDDMGIFGALPEGYLTALDPANSYKSRTITNEHSVMPYINYAGSRKKSGFMMLRLGPTISVVHRHFNYITAGKDYPISRTNAKVNIPSIWLGMIEYQFTAREQERGFAYNNSMRYSYRVESTLPELYDMVDIRLDSDPLNIYLGNPELHMQYRHRHLFRWSYTPQSLPFSNIFYVGYNHTSGALTRGYIYDTATGIRQNKMYNVDGNHNFAITNELSWQFGPKKQYTLTSTSDADFATLHDMVGINLSAPERTDVRNRILSEKLKFTWQIGSQSLSLRCDYTNRRTTSTLAGFNDFDAHHLNYGINGVFKLPAGFGASTDFTCYMRRGYGVEQLDTTDPIWNLRITYAPPSLKRWVFMVDGFDLLHKLNNVDYTVNEAGRMVSYTNSLPRYFLFSVQYRLNLQPKKH